MVFAFVKDAEHKKRFPTFRIRYEPTGKNGDFRNPRHPIIVRTTYPKEKPMAQSWLMDFKMFEQSDEEWKSVVRGTFEKCVLHCEEVKTKL